jgi:hypothetical protein
MVKAKSRTRADAHFQEVSMEIINGLKSITITPPIATLLVGILTAAVTIGGWIVVHYFTVRREMQARVAADARADRVKRLEILLKHAESQIGEFYGPIHGLIHQIWATWEVKQRIKAKLDSDMSVSKVFEGNPGIPNHGI